jgi:hypothetical protein
MGRQEGVWKPARQGMADNEASGGQYMANEWVTVAAGAIGAIGGALPLLLIHQREREQRRWQAEQEQLKAEREAATQQREELIRLYAQVMYRLGILATAREEKLAPALIEASLDAALEALSRLVMQDPRFAGDQLKTLQDPLIFGLAPKDAVFLAQEVLKVRLSDPRLAAPAASASGKSSSLPSTTPPRT